MIVTFELFGEKLQHMTQHQFGAFAAHCHRLPNFHSIQMWKTRIAVSFNTNKATLDVPVCVTAQETSADLQQAMEAFSSMEPFPCPCGCGAFISVSPCLRQSGELTECITLSDEEKAMSTNNPIGAIKSLRDRGTAAIKAKGKDSYMGLKDAKDIVDAWRSRGQSLGWNVLDGAIQTF